MKYGRSLQDLAAEITRQQDAKKDYLADTRKMFLEEDGKTLLLDPDQGPSHRFPLRDLALQQIGSHTGVPIPYLRRMQSDAPHLLARNVNHWFDAQPAERMVRTLDTHARAFLSNRYARIDNPEIAQVTLPVLAEVGKSAGGSLEIVSCEITEHRLYIKCVFPNIKGEVVQSRRVGDIVEAGVVISNSEVGLGAVSVRSFARLLACLNGMTREGGGNWKHVGRRIQETEDAMMYADDTKQADDRALLLKVRDTVAAAVDETRFKKWISVMNNSTQQKIEGDVPAAVQVLGNQLRLTKDESSNVLRHLIEGGDLSRWGLVNAVTRTAEDMESYDRATELESLGGSVLELAAHEWKAISTAVPLAA